MPYEHLFSFFWFSSPVALLVIGIATFFTKQMSKPAKILIGCGFVLTPVGWASLFVLAPYINDSNFPFRVLYCSIGLGVAAALTGTAMMLNDGSAKISVARYTSIILGFGFLIGFAWASWVAMQLSKL